MGRGFVTLRFCLLAFACLTCLSAEPINSRVSRYVDYLKEISSFLLSLCHKDQNKITNLSDLEKTRKLTGNEGGEDRDGDDGGGLRGDDIDESGRKWKDEGWVNDGKKNTDVGSVNGSKIGSGDGGGNKDSNKKEIRGGESYSDAKHKANKLNKPYFQDIEDEYKDEDSAFFLDDFTIEPYMTNRCSHPLEKPLITMFNIVYRDNETTPGYDCTHLSWRFYSHLGKMLITPVYFSIHHSMRSYKYQHGNSNINKHDKKVTALTIHDGFDEQSPVLFRSSSKGIFPLFKSYTSTKKRLFVKLTSGSFPTGWEFILKVETVKESRYKPEYMGLSRYQNRGVTGDYKSKKSDGGNMFSESESTTSITTKIKSYGDYSNRKNLVKEDEIKPEQKPLLNSLQKKVEEIKDESSLKDFENLEKETNKISTILENSSQQQNQQKNNQQPQNMQQQQNQPHKQNPQQQQNLKQNPQQQQLEEVPKIEPEDQRKSHFGIIPGLKLEGERRLVEGCEGNPMFLSTNYGALYSPNFQLATGYPSNSNCSWLITVDPGNLISLKFVSFSIEPPFPLTSLCFDALRVYDGPTIDQKTLKETYCGNKFPNDFVSSTNQLFLNFQSDSGMNNWPGFAIKYNSQTVIHNKILNPQCGHPKTQPSIYSRIVGGIQAKPHSWPWQISLQYEGNHICGACLLTSRWAVTAAHCLVDLDDISHLFLRLGEHNLTMVEGCEETRQIDGWHIHPNYNTNTNDYDLALIHLDEEVSFNDYVMPACLPSATMSFNNLICIVAGWGTTKDTQFNVVLNQLTVLFIESRICNDRKWYDGRVTKNMFCAGYKEGRRDSCQGDSGGPLVCSDGKHWSIYGVISWGFDCAQPRRPGVYTNVTLLQDWIVERIQKSPDNFE